MESQAAFVGTGDVGECEGVGLICRRHGESASHETSTRIENNVAEEGARRVGTLAILTAITSVGIAFLQHALQPELAEAHRTAVYRLAALFLVLASAGLASLQRFQAVSPQVLLDLGLVFEVGGAAALSVMENSLVWPDAAMRGSSVVGAWIALCVVLIPNRPWKSCTAAIAAALMVPIAHLLCAATLEYPRLPWNRLAAYSLSPFFIAAWTPFLSTSLYRIRKDLSHSAELGNYRLTSLLGKGGMGEVWLAKHRMLRRESAVKLIRPDRFLNTGADGLRRIQQRFELEAQSIASLRSPHTVALYDFGVAADGALYYVMELLSGMDMNNLVERYGPQPAGRVVSLMRDVCASLDEAHDAGMVHRDIKPTNLYVCRLGKQVDFVKVLDFGLVKSAIDSGRTLLTIQGETSGTPAFMSPEQVRGVEDIDGRADIYGVGCVAYYLLTGTLVFNKTTPMALALAHAEDAPEPPSARSELPIPASLEAIVMSCLEKDRERRPQSVSELVSLLDRCTDIPAWTGAEARRWWQLHEPALQQRKDAA